MYGENAGAAYLVLGPICGTLALSEASRKFTGEYEDDYSGTVAAGGDVNADGRDDVLVVGPTYGGSGAPAAYLVLGRGL